MAATEMTRSGCTPCSWNSPVPSAGNTGFYLSRSVFAKQYGWPGNPMTTEFGDWCRGKHITKRRSCCVHAWRQKDISLNTC